VLVEVVVVIAGLGKLGGIKLVVFTEISIWRDAEVADNVIFPD
jgi:hypothetical protein